MGRRVLSIEETDDWGSTYPPGAKDSSRNISLLESVVGVLRITMSW